VITTGDSVIEQIYKVEVNNRTNNTINDIFVGTHRNMETKRQKQTAELIKRNFSMILQQEGSYVYDDALVTVTNVQMSPDLSIAKIYLSVFNTDNKQAVLLHLHEHYFRLKQLFSFRMKKHIRKIPDFKLFLDDTLDEMYKLNALFDRLEKENQLSREEE
jgi:ribosome-binding factor A